jgi:DNA-binding NtrC family response regulator
MTHPAGGQGGETRALGLTNAKGAPAVRRFRLAVVEGPDKGKSVASAGDRVSIGTHESNDLVLADATVSRFHCEVTLADDGAHLRDLGSTNGTVLDGVQVADGFLRGDSLVRLGTTVLRFEFAAEHVKLAVSERTRFGGMTGVSVAMRAAFALLERAAASNATVLLEGETGTGKGQAARALHQEGPRAGGPFVTVDCAAIPATLLESELFGHERGAFTGAIGRRQGAFELASGGTIFLDEVGEMPAEIQPKFLRVLEDREVRRVGGGQAVPVDVRIVAATNRDLRTEVNAGRFRADLYFRLAVLRVRLPPLRQRPEDLPALVDSILANLDADDELARPLRDPAFLAQLAGSAWPGNVRELRNHLERCLVMQDAVPIGDEPEAEPVTPAPRAPAAPPAAPPPSTPPGADPSLPFVEARERALAAFEREYLEALLARHGGRTVRAAAAAGIGRIYLYKLLKKHGLR